MYGKNKILTLGVVALIISVVAFVTPVSAKGCGCKFIKPIDGTRKPISNKLITSGAIYELRGGKYVAVSSNKLSGINVFDIGTTDSERPPEDEWECFLSCITLAGGILTSLCMDLIFACISFPGPQNPVCWAALFACSVDIGVILGCYDLCYGGGGCFLAGTQVAMADGTYKRIEDIRPGDIVLSVDETTYTPVEGLVTKVYHHSADEMGGSYLIINGKVKVTPNHPLYMSDGSWKNAGDLEIGDLVATLNGGEFVRSIVKVYDRVPVYNIEVEPYGVYFVNGLVAGPKNMPKSDAQPMTMPKNKLVNPLRFNLLQRLI